MEMEIFCNVWWCVMFCFAFRLVNKEILDRLKVVTSQETLLIYNENIDVAVAHVSVSCHVRITTSCVQYALCLHAFLIFGDIAVFVCDLNINLSLLRQMTRFCTLRCCWDHNKTIWPVRTYTSCARGSASRTGSSESQLIHVHLDNGFEMMCVCVCMLVW